MDSGAYLNKLLFLWCAVIKNSSITGYMLLCLKTATELASEMLSFEKLDKEKVGKRERKKRGSFLGATYKTNF
jgi:hypothetical protein